MRRWLLLPLITWVGFGPGAVGGEAPPTDLGPETLAGELRGVVPPPGSPFRTIGEVPIGRFRLASAGGDLRANPATAILETPTGRLTATAVRVNEVRNVDVRSGRPRVAGADGACQVGTEASCWQRGEASRQNRAAFDALCDWMGSFESSGLLGSLLPLSACMLEIFNAPDVFVGTTVSAIFAEQLANGDRCNAGGGFCIVFNPLLGKSPFDPATAAIPLHPGLDDGARISLIPGLSGYLGPEQQALLGCGPFFGSHCDADGIDLFHAEAGAVFRGDRAALNEQVHESFLPPRCGFRE